MNLSSNSREIEAKRDSSLLGRIAGGDQKALAELYAVRSRLLYSLVLNTVGNVADAEEVTQQVFMKVWRKASTYNSDRGAPLAWLVTITRRLAIDRTRSKGYKFQKRSAGFDEVVVSALDQERIVDPTTLMLGRLNDGAIRDSLTQLNDKQLKVIHLSYYESMSHSEISETLNIPLGTVKSRLRQAIDQLRKVMKTEGSSR